MPWPKAPPTSLTKCVALALLLHLWLVLLLGNAPGGTAQQGLGVWGAINVTLRGPVIEGAAAVSLLLPAAPVPAESRPGDAPVPRFGGAVRSTEPLPSAEPGAARLGHAAPRVEAAADAPAPSAPAVAAAPPGRVVEERAAPALRAAPQLHPPLADAPPLPTAAALPAVPAPNAVIAAPRPDRQLVSPLTLPTSSAATAALPRLAAPPTLPELAAPPALAALAEAPPAVRRLEAPALQSAPALQPALPRNADLSPLPRSPDLPPLPVLAPAAPAGAGLPTARRGDADAGAQVGHDVATPPGAAASAAPRLNLELSRPRGGELSRFSTSGVLPVLPRLPERDEKLAREIEKAAKSDCRNAHTGLGLLAVIPLAVDAMRKDGGCKW